MWRVQFELALNALAEDFSAGVSMLPKIAERRTICTANQWTSIPLSIFFISPPAHRPPPATGKGYDSAEE